MKKLPLLLGHVRAFLARPADQDLIDATEDRMVNGPFLRETMTGFSKVDLQTLFKTIDDAKLKTTHMEMPEDVYQDILKWSGSPSGEGQVE